MMKMTGLTRIDCISYYNRNVDIIQLPDETTLDILNLYVVQASTILSILQGYVYSVESAKAKHTTITYSNIQLKLRDNRNRSNFDGL